MSIDRDKIKQDALNVKKLGEEIGYGHLMSLASALWRKHLIENGVPGDGAFIPSIRKFVKEEYQHPEVELMYDNFIKNI